MKHPFHLRLRTPASIQHGLTLIELMVTITILAVVLGLAAPSFETTIKRWRVNNARDAFISTIYLARSEALKHGGHITLQRNAKNDTLCPQVGSNSKNFGCGWQIFYDKKENGNYKQNEGDYRIQVTDPTKGVNVMVELAGPGDSKLQFDRWGQIKGLGASRIVFTPEPDGITSPATTTVCISSGGRVRTANGDATCR